MDPDFAASVYGLMKIATKYQVDSVCQAIQNHLESEWPTTLSDWLIFRMNIRIQTEGAHNIPFRVPGTRLALRTLQPEPASSIRLAIDYGIPSILPAAFYMLCTMSPDDEWDVDDETMSIFGDVTRGQARFWLLEEREQYRFYKGKYVLKKRADPKSVFAPFNCGMRVGTRKEGLTCELTATWLCDELSRKESFARADPDPIRAFESLYADRDDWKLCDGCKAKGANRIKDVLQKIWDDLPAIFSLGKYDGVSCLIVPSQRSTC